MQDPTQIKLPYVIDFKIKSLFINKLKIDEFNIVC